MKQQPREDLLGYMLGALDATETRQIEQEIKNNPELQKELESVESMVAPLEFLDAPAAPPIGLARRTVEYVAGKTRSRLTGLSSAVDAEFVRGGGWSVTDFVVGSVALLVLAAIVIPTMDYARYQSQIAACQNNLRQVGNALFAYQEMSSAGSFPPIPTSPDNKMNVAGIYAPSLIESELIEDEGFFFCAGIGTERKQRAVACIPTREMIERARGERLDNLKRCMGGDFGYSMGYYENGKYCAPRKSGRSNFIVLSDQPSVMLAGRQSANHRGKGQNCWFADGHIEYLRSPVTRCGDGIFENNEGVCGPGACRNDICVGASYASPIKSKCPSVCSPGKCSPGK